MKVFNFWIDETSFLDFVRKAYKSYNVQGWGAYVVKEKLKLLKKIINKWSVDKVGIKQQSSNVLEHNTCHCNKTISMPSKLKNRQKKKKNTTKKSDMTLFLDDKKVEKFTKQKL